ncbi:MAG: VTT domain-containing protein [Nanoarchaeota archaeon]|nr:VTT domain-containing protein [Nanoarchaeota archaeon]
MMQKQTRKLVAGFRSLFFSDLSKRIAPAVILILLLYISIYIFSDDIDVFLSSVSLISPIYVWVKSEIAKRSLIGLAWVTVGGALFFISYPAEVIFLLYVKSGYNPFLVGFIMLSCIMAIQVVNYYLGYFLGAKVLHIFIDKTRKKYSKYLNRFSIIFVLFANIFPLPADILTAILGVMRKDFKRSMFWTFLGQSIKYLALIILILFFENIF